ncbi:hypothetical protein A1353_18940 [Methylomonas methanica]|uniref:AAA+ ATPase domain-containing protein n=2 Tax=Methylomonas methanica TaxID=421 RepID=A0A177M577_METMH|nr:hypothetical protein A1353_18940 [Methylomonas methanica]
MPVNPSNALLTIPKIVWRAIYTVNVDDSVEQAYTAIDDRVQTLVPLVLSGDKAARNHDIEVTYYKLHGCLRHADSNLIFSHRDYTESREKNLKLFSSLTSELCDFPFLFIGFSLEDDDFQNVWESVLKYLGAGRRSTPTYLVTPNPQKSFVESLSLDGIDVIDDSVLSFFPWLFANNTKHAPSINDRVRSRAAPIQELIRRDFDRIVDAELVDQINRNFDFIRQVPNTLTGETTSRFLFGAQPKWEDIRAGLAITRELEQDILEDIQNWFDKPSFKSELIVAGAGYGKSTLLMQIALKVARWSQKVELLFLKSSGDFDSISLAEYSKNLNVPLIVIVDDIFRHLSSLQKLKADATDNRLSIYILGATRPADLNAARSLVRFDAQSRFDLLRLTENESRDLAAAMKRSGKLTVAMQQLSIDELANHYYEACEKHLLAGLLTSVSEDHGEFEHIIVEEYYRINNEKARDLYLAVSLAHSLGLPTPASLACNVVEVNLADYHSQLAPILDTTIIEFSHQISSDLMFMTQHRVISEALVHEVMRPADAVDRLLSFASCINPHQKEQYDILLRIYDEDYLVRLLIQPGTIRSCYDRLVEAFPSDTFIKQHFAIFESHQKNFKKAHELIDEALVEKERHPHFLNTKANILLREAIDEKDRGRAEHLFNVGTKLLRERIQKDSDKEIHILSLVGRQLDWAKRRDLTESQRLNALEEAEADLDVARAKYPTSSDISTLAAKLNIQLGQLPDAKNLLIRGVKLDGSNTQARTLLARILLQEGYEKEAYDLVDEGLPYSPKSYSLLHIRLEAARKLNLPWPKLRKILIEYLAIAENDLIERIQLIKGLIEASDIAAAKKQLEKLKRVEAPFSAKIRTIADVIKNGQPLVVEGEYIPRTIGKGFVKLFGYPEGMAAFLDIRMLPDKNTKLRQGMHIHMHLAINGLGLIARKIV